MFITTLFKRFLMGPSIKQAFAAVDEGDEQELLRQLDKGVSPDAILSGILEGYHVASPEFLLTHAIRKQQYGLALLLLDRGANPHARDEVTRNAKGLLMESIDRMGLLKKRNPNQVCYTDHDALRCLVALEWHRDRTDPPTRVLMLEPYFENWSNESILLQEWMDDQLLAYDAVQQGRDIAKAIDVSLSEAVGFNEVVDAAPRRRRM